MNLVALFLQNIDGMSILIAATFVCAAIPAFVFLRNTLLYRKAVPLDVSESPAVSLLIPARDEADRIEPTVRAALASRGVTLEVIVLDDHSTDGTEAIVSSLIEEDSRVRLETAPPLQPGWNGKQAACFHLAQIAAHEHLVFMDADVHLTPDALARSVGQLKQSGASLISGVPRQVTESFAERLMLPLIHFVLLGFLPMWRMRRSTAASYGAGCGQLFVTTKSAYDASGGHATIRDSMHDGLRLPRTYREAGMMTDLFDATDIAACRMYENRREVWNGLGKNAVEGLASPKLIVPATLLLFFGAVMPIILGVSVVATWSSATFSALQQAAVLAAVGLSLAPRLLSVIQFRQHWLSAILHPMAVVLFLAIQWQSLFRHVMRKPASWRGRSYAVGSASQIA